MTAIKDARTKTGLKQREVVALTGIPLGTLRRWEQGVNEPPIESIILLADLYGVSTDELLGSGFASTVAGSSTVTSDERRLLDLYRQCTQQGREYLMQVAEVTAGLFGRE